MIDFFNKIKQFFKNIISGNKTKMLEAPKEKELEIKNNQNDKKRFFEIYNKVKNGTADLYDIDREDLLKIRKILLEEAKIQDKKLEREIRQLELLKKFS